MKVIDALFIIAAILANNLWLCIVVLIVLILVVFLKSEIVPTYIKEKEETKRFEMSLGKKVQKKDHKIF
ncbi:hypothetical protein ACWESF_13760 [Staphylococcus xylosus]